MHGRASFLNKMITGGIGAAALMLLTQTGRAQLLGDTLQQVEVRRLRQGMVSSETKVQHYLPGQKVLTIDSSVIQQYRQGSLSDLISQQLPVFVKSYGFNSAATLNFRGASAAQSQVLWEGVPLQNASSGIADVSALPLYMLDDIKIVYGSSAALLGSGNVGGAVLVGQKPPSFEPGLKADGYFGYGSFQHYTGNLNLHASGRKFDCTIGGQMQSAKNNFSYVDADGVGRQMENDSLGRTSVAASLAYRADASNIISLKLFAQQLFRQIPPATFERSSVRRQQDETVRVLTDWRHHRRQQWYLKLAYLHDALYYSDSASQQQSANRTHQVFSEWGWEKSLSANRQLLVFVPAQLLFFDGKEDHAQLRVAVAGAYRQSWLRQRLQAALNARAELIDGKGILLPGVNASYALSPRVSLQGNAQYTYRTPTLNELYYQPGGNDHLQPERGWNLDAGYRTASKLGAATFTHNAAVYSRYIKDWIIWLGGAIWTPHNLASVHSRGIETENRLEIRTGQLRCSVSASGSYTRATTASSYLANDKSIGKQIPYMPAFNGALQLAVNWRGFHFSYSHAYTGYRFITADESQRLDPYATATAFLTWEYRKGNWRLQPSIQCQNVFDRQYEVVGFRPMPGRNWMLGVAASFY